MCCLTTIHYAAIKYFLENCYFKHLQEQKHKEQKFALIRSTNQCHDYLFDESSFQKYGKIELNEVLKYKIKISQYKPDRSETPATEQNILLNSCQMNGMLLRESNLLNQRQQRSSGNKDSEE